LAALVATLGVMGIWAPSSLAYGSGAGNPFCKELGNQIQASSAAQSFCFGPQQNGPNNGQSGSPATSGGSGGTNPSFGSNIDAANPSEDISPSGVQFPGQSETSLAATGPYVVEAWNDATGFFSPCPSPMNKEELTGFGFSADGGSSFVDKGGLPNSNCGNFRLQGDPSVEAWQPGGTAYFYIASLYDSAFFFGESFISVSACKATGTGASASLSCGQPIKAAHSTQSRCSFFCFGSFLDKDFLSIDPARGRLYVTYTEFGGSSGTFEGQPEMSVCDIGSPSGGTGPAGGTAGRPVCETGNGSQPYLVLAPGGFCEQEGTYPAVDVAAGDVYVAWEYNWFTDEFGGCLTQPTRNVVEKVPSLCLPFAATSPCSSFQQASVNITSMDAQLIPGYNRFAPNDFPRIAVDDPAGTVSIVWNDARTKPLGDILLQSFALGSLAPVQSAPVRINDASSGANFLPALRKASPSGGLQVSWYQRATPNTAQTDLRAVRELDPRTTKPPPSTTRITTSSSDWNAVSSFIVPNFGDYTDNYLLATPTTPYTGRHVFFAWSDGRLGIPQPFEDNMSLP
jgi:hypothetical protein